MSKAKIILGIVMVIVVAGVGILALTSFKLNESEDVQQTITKTDKNFTKETIKDYNGKNGNPGYVAIDGVVYDISDKKLLRGSLRRELRPGVDATRFVKRDPRVMAVIKELPVVGTYNNIE